MTTLLDQVRAFCDRHDLVQPDTAIVVAVSGGPDSLCLLHLLHEIGRDRGLQLHVAHLDHQLRAESADDARFVAEVAAAWNLPCIILHENIAAIARERRMGLEAAARMIRHRFLLDVALNFRAAAIALGHTADDQAETVIMRLLRGAGTSGLAAMRPQRVADRDHPQIKLIRPLLETARAAIEAYCDQHQLLPRHDASNDLPIYTRNRVRGYILPLLKTYNSNIVATLGRTARICADEDELLGELADSAWQRLATVDENGVWLDRAGLAELHTALQRRVLRIAAAVLVPEIELEARHLDLALEAIANRRRRWQFPHGVWLFIRPGFLRLKTDRA